MKFSTVIDRLRGFAPPPGWGPTVFLFPEAAMEELYDTVVTRRPARCLELGTGFGATTCVLAAALEEVGAGCVVSIDRFLHEPVNARVLLAHAGIPPCFAETVVEPLGYNWWLADRLASGDGGFFDLCFLDGAHEFETDALAFTLARSFLRPRGLMVLDDLNFHLRQVPRWREEFGARTDRELDTEQVRMIWELLVVRDPAFHHFQITCDGRVGWAEKKRPSLLA